MNKLSNPSINQLERASVEEDVQNEYFSPCPTFESLTQKISTDFVSMPYLQSCLSATVLEDTLTEFRILEECNSGLKLRKAYVDMALLRALKFGIKQSEINDELEYVDVRRLHCMEYKINKLDSDRKGVQKSLLTIYLDLALRRSCAALVTEVDNILYRIHHAKYLVVEEEKNRNYLRDLHRQVRQRRNYAKTVFYDTDCIIVNLRTQVEDAALNAAVRNRYIDKWQCARTEQNTQLIHCKEAVPSNNIENYKQKSDQEQRVHSEIEYLVTIAITETLHEVEIWMEKYEKDIEAADLKIQIMKSNYQSQMEEREELEKTIEKHTELMKQWVDFKDARVKAQQYRIKMTNAAIVVQAWWRGLLVRCQLGPYRPSKKRGKDKKRK